MNMLEKIRKELRKEADPSKTKILSNFFKTGKGEYGEGDKFLGVSVPNTRKIAKRYEDISFERVKSLLDSKFHEERLLACLILVEKYKKGNIKEKEEIYKFYLKNSKKINNWDLVDLTADKILGNHIYNINNNTRILNTLATSDNLWRRRVSIVSTYYFIKNNNFEKTIEISNILMNDKHDLIHKATGWMLREMGKRDKKQLIEFLDKNHKIMPRTMLRYSIEKLSQKEKDYYMEK